MSYDEQQRRRIAALIDANARLVKRNGELLEADRLLQRRIEAMRQDMRDLHDLKREQEETIGKLAEEISTLRKDLATAHRKLDAKKLS